MLHKRIFFNLLVTISLIFGGAVVITQAAPSSLPAHAPAADLPGYTYSAEIKVSNGGSTVLLSGYTVSFSLDTAVLVSEGKLQDDCEDLRISFAAEPEVEIDRLVSGCNTASTQVTFRTQADIDPGTADARYIFNFGNTAAAAPPQNPASVYDFYDDFQDGDASGWNAEKGTWTVVDDGTGNYVYRYTGGGTGWALSSTTLAASDIDYLAKIRAIDTPKTDWIGLAFRISDPNNFLTFYQSRDTNNFKFARILANNHNIINPTPAYTMNANAWYWLHVQAVGSTVRARIWEDTISEPAAWIYSSASETTFQTSQNIGLTLYNHLTTADWDAVQVRRLVAVEPVVTLSAWWNDVYHYRNLLTLTNTSTTAPLPLRYSARFTLDTATLIGSGQMKSDCSDLRLIYNPGLSPVEIDRVVEKCNTSETVVWFAAQRPVAPSGIEQAYSIYYGNAAAVNPPADGMDVFLYFEDWEQGAAHWTNAGGLDLANTGTMGTSIINTEAALSASNSQKFTARVSGGDALSGFIAVEPSKMYAVGVWATTPSASVCVPVGINTYTSTSATGVETWFWTNNWPTASTPAVWSWRSANFTTLSTTTHIKIKSELWSGCTGTPVYLDNLALYYSISSAPTLVLGDEDTNLPVPTIDTITDNGPLSLGSAAQVSAHISTPAGTINSAVLRILSPVVAEYPMSRVAGSESDGTWQAGFTPAHAGVYTYRVYAESTTGTQRLSPQATFTVTEAIPPVITFVSKIDPILVRNIQTLVVQVTDNDTLSSVNVTIGGVSHPMTANGSQYSYSWQVMDAGTITYTVTAVDASTNTATLSGSFVSQPREADVCTWLGCRQGAASWSVDDGNSACRTELEAAGIRGTYFYNGTSTLSWFSTYSAAGHEIASHTVGHDCTTPACFNTCTKESLAALPVVPAAVQSYRLNQLEPNIAAIEAGTGKPVLSLAWPCGCTDPSRWEAARNYYLGARGYYDWVALLTWVEDINNPTPENFMLLNTANAYRQDFIDRAYSEGKWATITSHGSCAGIDYMGAQSANGNLWVAPIGEVLKYIYVRDASQLTNYVRAERTISFDVAHNLPPWIRPSITATPYVFRTITYDNEVTLKVHILDTDTVSSVTVDGNPVTYNILTLNGLRYVTLNAALNTYRHVVVNLAAPAPSITNVIVQDTTVELGTSAQITATVVPASGTTLSSVTLRVLSPESHDYPMTLVSGSQYAASFVPAQLGVYTYRVIAANNESATSQSAQDIFAVIDTTAPQSQNQSQTADQIVMGNPNILSAEGYDLGGLVRAVLSTNESGTWQDFEWPTSDWWNYNWSQRRAVTLTESAGLARNSETVELLVDTGTFAGLTSCNELRVVDENRVELPVQVTASAPPCRLLFQADLAANTDKTVYVYYGNASAPLPSYTSDLTATTNGDLRTIQNTYFDIDLNGSATSGVLSRVRLPLGSNTNLPLSSSANAYWGWHQVCSAVDGNITGKNSLCAGGTAQASGLTLTETLSGPLSREYTLTSIKGAATYTITYRFYANAPYYQYTLARAGTTAAVMNNFWYLNGNFARLGAGSGGTPLAYFNTYDNTTDHILMASLAPVAAASIDGTDNDGTDLGGTAYNLPTAAGLNLYVATGTDQAAAQGMLARLNTPISSAIGAAENAPQGTHGSPIILDSSTTWESVAFNWQHPTLNNQRILWRIKFYDASGNTFTTNNMSFDIGIPTAVVLSSFSGEAYQNTVQLDWATANELHLLSFNIYRSETIAGAKEQRNTLPIEAKWSGSIRGDAYQFIDDVEPGKRYYYWLQLVPTSGSAFFELPVEVNTNYVFFIPFVSR